MTRAVFDSILVATDKLSKYAHFIPFKEACDARGLSYIFLKEIVSTHRLPEKLISDRDKLFASKFWTSLMSRLGAQQKLSTAYHPKTDGQTERLNQTLEQYLRCYVNYWQDNWVSLLPLAQFAYNSATNETTKYSPFYVNYRYKPQAYREPLADCTRAQTAITDATEIQDL